MLTTLMHLSYFFSNIQIRKKYCDTIKNYAHSHRNPHDGPHGKFGSFQGSTRKTKDCGYISAGCSQLPTLSTLATDGTFSQWYNNCAFLSYFTHRTSPSNQNSLIQSGPIALVPLLLFSHSSPCYLCIAPLCCV